jgi:hypothetical protein
MKVRQMAAALCLALPLAAGAAAAQDTPSGLRPYRFTFEAHLTRAWYQDDLVAGAGKTNVGGFGGRVLFNRSETSRGLRTFFGRASTGIFADYTADQGSPESSTLHYGVEGQSSLFSFPLARGTIDPIVSLGAGVMRTTVDLPGGDVNRNDFAITPGSGVRIPLFSGLGFRGDVRLPIVFGDETTANLVASGGMYLSF